MGATGSASAVASNVCRACDSVTTARHDVTRDVSPWLVSTLTWSLEATVGPFCGSAIDTNKLLVSRCQKLIADVPLAAVRAVYLLF